jgi:hypothetical protein
MTATNRRTYKKELLKSAICRSRLTINFRLLKNLILTLPEVTLLQIADRELCPVPVSHRPEKAEDFIWIRP